MCSQNATHGPENARLEDFAGSFVAEERMAADPQAWGYLNRGVVAAVQALERRGGFKADHVYSHSIRGYASVWNTRALPLRSISKPRS